MSKTPNTNEDKPHALVGIWVNGDEYASDVEYHVSQGSSGFAVRAVDRCDGEEAQIYDVKWENEALSFATHWPSTGRFVKCRLFAISPNRVDFTYTYTQQEMWHRKGTGPTAPPNHRPARRRTVRRLSRRTGQ